MLRFQLPDAVTLQFRPPRQMAQARSHSAKCMTLLKGLSCTIVLLAATNSGAAGSSLAESTRSPEPWGRTHQVTGPAGTDASLTTVFDPREGFVTCTGTQQRQRVELLWSRELLSTTEFMIEILPICNIMHLITSTFALVSE